MSRAREMAKLNPTSALSLQALVGVNGKFPCFTADDVFRLADIVGTVSQTSGVPTGAIVEKGSNANGDYVRYADGTQVCWYLHNVANTTPTTAGDLFISSASVTLTYPIAFIAYPDVADACRFSHPTLGNAASSRAWGHVASLSTSLVTLLSFGVTATSAVWPGYIAYGRWY